MKEKYIAPELECLGFAADEQLTNGVNFDDLIDVSGGGVSALPEIDVDVPIH